MMNKLIDWLNNGLTPRVNKLSKNIWIQSIQNAIMLSLPMIFVGSLISVISLLKNIWPSMPDLNPINQFSFGLFSIFVAFLLPYQIMDKKGLSKKKTQVVTMVNSKNESICEDFVVWKKQSDSGFRSAVV